MATEEPGKNEGRVIGRAVLPDGGHVVRRQAADVEFDQRELARRLRPLQSAIIRYLASDGSFGLYNAGEVIKARDEIMQIISRESIDAAQTEIRVEIKKG